MEPNHSSTAGKNHKHLKSKEKTEIADTLFTKNLGHTRTFDVAQLFNPHQEGASILKKRAEDETHKSEV